MQCPACSSLVPTSYVFECRNSYCEVGLFSVDSLGRLAQYGRKNKHVGGVEVVSPSFVTGVKRGVLHVFNTRNG
jgi:hypothetical protein